MLSSRVAVVLLVAASSLAITLSQSGGVDYGYAPGSKLGPENWAKLSPDYKLCGVGKNQSPINIVTKQAVSKPNLDTLNRTYDATDGVLVNNGKDITMTFEGKQVGTVTVSGKVYRFKKATWHAPAEHTINGERHPLELQLLHKSDDGNIAIISILYKYGAPDSFYFQLKKELEELAAEKCNFSEEDAQLALGLVHLRSLQKRTGSYFRYSGSLTTPPCTENVIWNVLGKMRQISKDQVDLLTAPLHGAGGFRPTQPLNGRPVQFYNPPNSTISFDM